ncbi:hypothetical protein AAC387_Pa12g1621 [Persea americana]
MHMALPRLSLAERRLLLQNQAGFLKATRSLSLSSSSSAAAAAAAALEKSTKTSLSKRREAAKVQKAAAVESLVKKYMLMNPGVFPKIKQVQNELGGSWYVLKDILAELKEKMTGDPQAYKEIASAKADIMLEAASEAAVTDKNEVGAMVNDPESTVYPLDLHIQQKIMKSVKSLVMADKASEEIAIQEGTENEKLVENDDRSRQLNSQLSPVVIHESDRKAASQQLTSMIERLISNEEQPSNAPKNGPDLNDAKSSGQKAASHRSSFIIEHVISNEVEAPNASQNDLNLNHTKSSDRTVVENEELLSDVKVNQRPGVNKMPSDGEKPTGVVDSHETRHTNTGADKKNAMKIETLNRHRYPGTTMASANEFEKKKCMPVFIDRFMEFVKSKVPCDIVDKSNPHRTLINKNGMGTALEGMQFLNPDEEQKTLCEHDISNDTRKPERGKTWAEPLDLVVENTSGTESKFIDHASICDETDHNDNNGGPLKVPFEMFESQKDGSGSDSDSAALDYPSESATDISPPINVLKPRTFLHTERKTFQEKLLVRFLKKTATEKDIGAAFGNCGPITNIRIVRSRKENRFNCAYINFKTAAGLQNAQVKTDIVINGADVVVEAVSPFLRNPVKIPTPSTFGCPDVLNGLLRHPSRTVMIKPLPHDLASHHLRRALSVFGCISGFAMGSLSSIAYVEFETEDAKEKALAMSSISISGRKLAILRIDAPLTTVVRISNFGSLSGEEIHNICNSHGRVKRVVFRRNALTVDVHFMLTEWSNMAKIINSLNSLVINELQWQAQPAPAIPPEILQMLWRKPDGRRYVCSLAQSLCRKIQLDSTNTSKLTDLLTEYHGESIQS